MPHPRWHGVLIELGLGAVLAGISAACTAAPPSPSSTESTASVSSTAPSTAQPAAPNDLICDGSTCLSPSIFIRRLHEQLDGRVVGYVGFVGAASVMAAGDARKPSDPPQIPMGPDTLLNTASVGKMFTTAVVLKDLDRQGLGVDLAIGPYLPTGWKRGPGIEKVTFRDLLTHRAGFRLDSSQVFTNPNAARDQVALGVRDSAKKIALYNNINFSIMRDLLPQIDKKPVGSADQHFIDSVQRDVFDPVAVRSATCAEPVVPMLYYPPPADAAAPGRIPPVGPAACSSGGWFITATDLFRCSAAWRTAAF